MQVLKDMEGRLREIWSKAQSEKDSANRSKLLNQYFKMYRSYKLKKVILEGIVQ